MKTHVEVSVGIERTARVVQLEGMFGLERLKSSTLSWDVELPLEERDWQIGLITGPSGSGKTTIARALWPEQIADRREWPHEKSLLDGFSSSISDATKTLTSVGFSSPPAWLRPHHVLSTGEQFRADVARTIAEADDDELIVIDEFTSVVDRTVAQVGSAAIAKTIRSSKRKFVAVTCHSDIIEWLQPDWVYRPHSRDFEWRRLQHRPQFEIDVERASRDIWPLFAPHHYLNSRLLATAKMFVAYVDGEPIALNAVTTLVSQLRGAVRSHRLVVLPDYQGIGIGGELCDFVAAVHKAAGRRFFATSGHPARVRRLAKSKLWRATRKPGMVARSHGKNDPTLQSHGRITAGFEYVGPPIESCLARELL